MKKITQCVIGAGLAFAATCASANSYAFGETGYVADDDGRVYSYVIYGTGDDASPIVTSDAQDVNADSRGSSPAVQLPVDEESVSDDSDRPTVAIGSPDVNIVKGRA
ncbi:MAG: hypothetical protein ABI771_13450 [Betaproteobacteria bacterium]